MRLTLVIVFVSLQTFSQAFSFNAYRKQDHEPSKKLNYSEEPAIAEMLKKYGYQGPMDNNSIIKWMFSSREAAVFAITESFNAFPDMKKKAVAELRQYGIKGPLDTDEQIAEGVEKLYGDAKIAKKP